MTLPLFTVGTWMAHLPVMGVVVGGIAWSRFHWGSVVPGTTAMLLAALALLPSWNAPGPGWVPLAVWVVITLAHGCIWQTAFMERGRAGPWLQRLWFGVALLLLAPVFALVPWPTSWPVVLVALFGLLLQDHAARTCVGRAPRPVVAGPALLNTLFGYTTFATLCSGAVVLLPLVLLLPRRPRQAVLAALIRWAMRLVFFSAPTIHFRYEDPADQLSDATVVVSNHEGMLDILASFAVPGRRNGLAKNWVLRTPFLGWGARACGVTNTDVLPLDAYATGDLRRLAGDFAGLHVFPEGQRSRDGRVHRFHQGAFVIARGLGVPVLPLAIAGSFTGIRPGSPWIHPSAVVARALEPFHCPADEDAKRTAARCRDLVIAQRTGLRRTILREPVFLLRRRQHLIGLPVAMRCACTAEYREGRWRALLDHAPADADRWLVIGCGWSSSLLVLRDLDPAARIFAWEPAALRRRLAIHAWVAPSDRLVADFPLLPKDGYHACLCQSPPPAGWPALAAALTSCRCLILPAAWADEALAALPGWGRTDAAAEQAVLAPRTSRLAPTPADEAGPAAAGGDGT
jgi:1-acyl-sn-glycerol-3-phosphate acyltransferase